VRKKIDKKFWQVKTMKTEFSSGTLTNSSGILPIYQFMQKLNIFNSLDKILIYRCIIMRNIQPVSGSFAGMMYKAYHFIRRSGCVWVNRLSELEFDW